MCVWLISIIPNYLNTTMLSAADIACLCPSGLNVKEKLFIPLAWLPKATVQAAIGSLALDTARALNAGPHQIELGQQVCAHVYLMVVTMVT